MNEVMTLTKLSTGQMPNRNVVTTEMQNEVTALLPHAVDKAKEIMLKHCEDYIERINPQIDEELEKLIELQAKHKDYQLSLFEDERRKSEQERKVDAIFDSFTIWVKETLEIENNPYIRVIAAMIGGD
jgi:Rps23 Pro-64 3,4-dihydroxylase Tpa1-like proline 4-hydroxylase